MGKNKQRIFSAITVLAVAIMSCNLPVRATPTTAPIPPTETEKLIIPTEAPTTTNEPPREIYAGFTQNKEVPFLMVHQSGESLGAIGDTNAPNLEGAVWVSADEKTSIVIHADSNGLPKSAVIGDDLILYSNYTNETVDITVLQSDGKHQTFKAKRDIEKINKITAFLTPGFSEISFSRSHLGHSTNIDQLALLKQLATLAGAASCLYVVSAPVLPPLAALALPCIGTLITGITLYGKMLGIHVAFLDNLGAAWSAFKCPIDLANLNPISCISTYATLMQKLKELANQKIESANSNYSGLQLGTIPFDPVPTNTPLAPPPTPTDILQPVSSLRGSVLERSNCRYGPDSAYLYKYGLKPETRMEVIGRDADGDWLYVQGVGGKNPCWLKASQIKVNGDIMRLPDAYPITSHLPISPFFEKITILGVSGGGGTVTVRWQKHVVRADLNTEQGIEYIVEVWTCRDGKPLFYAVGTNDTTATFKVDYSCGQHPHADIIGEDKEGFSIPAPIAIP